MALAQGAIIADRFEIERLAGMGGMGAVYRALDRRGGGPVALKVLHDVADRAAGERFEREAGVLADLSHPGIVRYVAHGRAVDGRRFLAMEWLEGEDLGQRLARTGLSVTETIGLGARAAAALAAAHDRHVVHRDIKPSNLFLVGGDLERLKLVDFGVARLGNATHVVTMTGAMVGTPGYMAPEQARGARHLDGRADVFSLGCVLFECLTGRPPFVGEGVVAVLAKILLEDAPRATEVRQDLPQEIDDLVARMLSKEREGRPRDAAAVAQELAQVAAPGRSGAAERPRTSVRVPALTGGELRYMSVILARPLLGTAPTIAESIQAPTLTPADVDPAGEGVRAAVKAHGGRLERLVDGTLVVGLDGGGLATDQAARAGRCALALRALLPEAPIALATGRGDPSTPWPVGEVIDRAGRLLGAGTASVRLDDVTSGLLDGRFTLAGAADGALELVSVHEDDSAVRTLLGRPSPCVGRARELGALTAIVDECVGEPVAHAVLVTGPAGVGKSRLRQELTRALGERDEPIEIWTARADAVRAGSPFGLIAPLIRRVAGVLDGEPARAAAHKLRARLGRHLAGEALERVAAVLGELVGVPAPEDAWSPLGAVRQDPVALGDHMRAAWEDWLAAECAAQPVVLVIEDLHWGDVPSVRFIDAALRTLHDQPLLVVALARPEVHAHFPRLWADRRMQELRLAELTRKASEKLVREALGDAASPAVVDRIVDRAGGNAFFLEELVRAVAEGRGGELPETVLAMVQARLEAMEPDARRLLRAAAVFGQHFWRRSVATLLGPGFAPSQLGEWLEELGRREVIAPRRDRQFPGEEEYVFRHALVREAAYAMLTDADRGLGHRLAGEWLERAGEKDPIVLAEHFERGGEPGRALPFHRRAAEQALEGGDLAAVVVHAEHGIRCGAAGEELGALRRLQAEAHQWRGENAEAERCGLEALTHLAPDTDAWWRAAGEVVLTSIRVGRMNAAVAAAEDMVARWSDDRATDARAIGCLASALAFTHRGNYALSDRLRVAAERYAATVPRPLVSGWVHRVRSAYALYRGDLGSCTEEVRAAIAAFDAAGSHRNALAERGNLGYCYLELGAFEEAEAMLAPALAGAERAEIRPILSYGFGNLAMARLRRGATAAALDAIERGLAHTAVDLRAYGSLLVYRAAALIATGDHAGALAAADAGLEKLEAALPALAQALGYRARALRLGGRAAEGLECARRAMEHLERHGTEEGEGLIRLEHAEALRGAGDRPGASAAIREARDLLLARAEKITDPAWRRSFLERIAEHARTIALAEAWA